MEQFAVPLSLRKNPFEKRTAPFPALRIPNCIQIVQSGSIICHFPSSIPSQYPTNNPHLFHYYDSLLQHQLLLGLHGRHPIHTSRLYTHISLIILILHISNRSALLNLRLSPPSLPHPSVPHHAIRFLLLFIENRFDLQTNLSIRHFNFDLRFKEFNKNCTGAVTSEYFASVSLL